MYLFDVFQVCSVASTESDVSKQGVEDVVSDITFSLSCARRFRPFYDVASSVEKRRGARWSKLVN